MKNQFGAICFDSFGKKNSIKSRAGHFDVTNTIKSQSRKIIQEISENKTIYDPYLGFPRQGERQTQYYSI